MAFSDQAVLVARVLQIILALIAFSVTIADCAKNAKYYGVRGRDFGTGNAYLMMAGIMTTLDTAVLGCVGVLATLRPKDLARWLMVVFDILALTAAIAAGKCISKNWGNGWDRLRSVSVIFAYLSAVPIVFTIARGMYLLYRGEEEQGQVRLADESSSTMDEVRNLSQRVEQLETEARSRS